MELLSGRNVLLYPCYLDGVTCPPRHPVAVDLVGTADRAGHSRVDDCRVYEIKAFRAVFVRHADDTESGVHHDPSPL